MPGTLFVADVGNSSIDIAEFDARATSQTELPTPLRTEKLILPDPNFDTLDRWLQHSQDATWYFGSVNDSALQLLKDWLRARSSALCGHDIDHSHLNLISSVRSPSSVGIDRFAAGLAANMLRHPTRPAIVVDAGSAITIDVVSTGGVFLGGLIAPGIQLSQRALAHGTSQLPSVESDLELPELIGDNTTAAIQAGVFWMAVAGIDGVVKRLQDELAGPCDIFVTGGTMPQLLPHFHNRVRHEPTLVLSGLSMARP